MSDVRKTMPGKSLFVVEAGSMEADYPERRLDRQTRPDQVDAMKIVNVQEAKTHLSRLLEQAASGEVILIGKYGKPMAKLTAYAPHAELRPLGGLEGQIEVSPDFDDEDPRIQALFLPAME